MISHYHPKDKLVFTGTSLVRFYLPAGGELRQEPLNNSHCGRVGKEYGTVRIGERDLRVIVGLTVYVAGGEEKPPREAGVTASLFGREVVIQRKHNDGREEWFLLAPVYVTCCNSPKITMSPLKDSYCASCGHSRKAPIRKGLLPGVLRKSDLGWWVEFPGEPTESKSTRDRRLRTGGILEK